MRKVRLGLALGGGGARGYAHLGVIKVLQKTGISIDILAGSSMGAVVGAAWATGYSIAEMESIARNTRWGELLRLTDITFPRHGLILGRRLEDYYFSLIGGRKFAELRKPLTVVACDLISGDEVRLRSGPLARALRASTAIPGIFAPVFLDDRVLVDGCVVSPVPLLAAVEMGASVVIAVDVGTARDRPAAAFRAGEICCRLLFRHGRDWYPESRPPGFLGIVERSLMLNRQRNSRLDSPCGAVTVLLIKPRVERVRWYEFQRVDECVAAGEEAGRRVLDQLQKLIE
ncbi:patatin-like phospholipase family protein [Desulforudis sp. 1088]|uniref:patatin-like phospholipase family protein n=1 Tax=unclassified Candidatus Desulforudis TaxID=2635950 RepID=UPI0034906C65